MPLADAKISILTHALHYGTGVFEGIRGYWSATRHEMYLFRPAEHYTRWKQNCGLLRMDLAHTEAELCHVTSELVIRNHFETDIYIRPLAYRSSPKIGVCPDDQYAIAIIAIPFGKYLESSAGLHAGVASWRRVEDNAIPARGKICGAYVNSALATVDAHLSGFDEAIFLNEAGHVVEGATCNIFLVRHGKLITPPPSDNILEGITRESIIDIARRELGLEAVERSVDRSELYQCEEAFFTGTAVEVAPITRIDHHLVGHGEVGPIATTLRQLYNEIARGEHEEYRRWIEPVYQPALHRV